MLRPFSRRLGFLPLLAACAGGGPAASPARPADDARVLAANIAFYEGRTARDPYGARDRAVLGALYLARSRATGGAGDLDRAEALARESLTLRHGRNTDAARVLAASLMAAHRFSEARTVLLPLAGEAPEDVVTRATLGEIALELGRYAEADTLFSALAVRRMEPAVGTRYARWLELSGRAGEARLLLEELRRRQAAAFRVPAAELAWLDLRLAELAMRNGRPDLAARALARGRAMAPGDTRLLAAQARLAAGEGDWRAAESLGTAALALLPEPGTLALLADLARARGDSAQAREYEHGLVAMARSGAPGSLHREWALHLLDQGRADRALTDAIERQHAERHDVYTHDLVAWARFRAGRLREAEQLADSALARGVRDPLLLHHAAQIALAGGDTALARARLQQALAISPDFPAVTMRDARRRLQELEARP